MRKDLTAIQDRYQKLLGPLPAKSIIAAHQAVGVFTGTSERGYRTTPENAIKYLYRQMWADPDVRATIIEIRRMDHEDGRVKKIHRRTAAAAIKGGLKLNDPGQSAAIKKAWDKFRRRLQLDRREKLFSDARGLIMEGNLPMQWVLDQDRRTVVSGIRMPTETFIPQVHSSGQFTDPAFAYLQQDLSSGAELARFALWQLSMVRLMPDNFDDNGSFGRPYLDASRTIWKKLKMTEEDLVLRRRTRAPLRMAHVLEGASEPDLQKYEQDVIRRQQEGVTTDFFLNRKGAVTAVQGDANMDQIADVAHLLDTFFAGSPAPKGLFGYTEGLNRDILEDLKRDFFEEVDAMQDELAMVYQLGFQLQLLLDGISPETFDFQIQFAERRTETANQAADRALKLQAMGASQATILETAGIDPATEDARRKKEKQATNPYPDQHAIRPAPGQRVSITPGNARKGESATSVSNQ